MILLIRFLQESNGVYELIRWIVKRWSDKLKKYLCGEMSMNSQKKEKRRLFVVPAINGEGVIRRFAIFLSRIFFSQDQQPYVGIRYLSKFQ